jgi:MFS family permease
MLYPILPIFLTQILHASGSVVGVVEGIAEATQNVVQGFSGWLSDKLRKRKALALIGYFVSALGKPFMGIAAAWPGVLGGRFLDRLGAGFRSAPRDALIASSVSDEYRGRAFGLEGIGDNLGAFLGPLLAVLLFLTVPFRDPMDFFRRNRSRTACLLDDPAGSRTASPGGGKVQNRYQFARVPRRILEIPVGDSDF